MTVSEVVLIPGMTFAWCGVTNHDSIQVYEGTTSGWALDYVCHPTPAFHVFYSATSTMVIRFRTDNYNEANGFKFHWDIFGK